MLKDAWKEGKQNARINKVFILNIAAIFSVNDVRSEQS